MFKPFLQMIAEAQEIDEMAIKPEDFPDTYLAAAKSRGARARQISPLIKRFHDELKTLRWQDITWITRGSSYYPILPTNLLEIIKEARNIIGNNTDSFMDSIIVDNFGNWATPNDQGNRIHMEVDSGQRSHFPGGIPKSIRNVGLGYKLYRGLLEKKTWLRSNTAGTLEKDNAWASLISPKVDEQGNLTEDDVHAILGRHDVCAIIKTLPNPEKIRIAKNFIDNNISARDISSTNFAIDDELKAILPADFVAQLDPAERERIERERRERERQEQEARARQYGVERGIQWDEQPTEQSLVYVRGYATNRDLSIPLRIIALIENGRAKAISLPNYITWVESGSDPNQLNTIDNRSCEASPEEIKSYFVKVDPEQIPGLAEDSAVFLDEYTNRAIRNKVREFVMGMVDPESAARARAEREEAERVERERTEREAEERRARRASDTARFGEPFENFEDSAYKEALTNRVPGGQRISKMIKRGPQEIALSPAQVERFNRRKSSEVFANIGGDFYNTITGYEVEGPIGGMGFVQFRLDRFTSKRAVTPNEMLYIASHNTYYGLIAPVDYVVLNNRNEEYIYLRVYDNTSRTARKVAIKVSALRKIAAVI